jgi:hypothetical protein
MISFKTQDLNLKEDVAELLCQIDKRLVKLGKIKLNSDRFGTYEKVDEEQCFILAKYREILMMKLCSSPCLKYYKIDDIISIVKQYLTTGKVTKFTSCELAGGDTNNTSIVVDVRFNAPVVYNFYNYQNIITNNIVQENNTFEDNSWDQTSW